MADQAKNILIGLFVIAACAIIVFLMLFLHPKVGDEARKLRIRFANIDKVTVGTRVTYAGKPVGEVLHIREVDDPKDPRQNVNGFVYIYELILAVDSTVNVYNTDDVSLRTSGLLGEKSVAITPLPPKHGEPLKLINNEIIYANETGSVEETLKEFKELSDKFELALDGIIGTVEDIKDEKLWNKIGSATVSIEKTSDTVDQTAQNLRSITSSANKPKEISELVDNIHTLSAKALDSWAKIEHSLNNISQASDKIISASDDIKQITTDSRTVVTNIKNGEGTAGKLLVDDDIYLRTIAIMNKLETVVDDVNHYGLLFHLDKGWQRLRARRANLLSKLCSPQEFRNFFNDEMDQITTSLSRVAQVMEKTQTQCDCSDLAYDPDFVKVFSELLRRVDGLEKSLQMYNDQLQDIKVQETELSPCY